MGWQGDLRDRGRLSGLVSVKVSGRLSVRIQSGVLMYAAVGFVVAMGVLVAMSVLVSGVRFEYGGLVW